MAGWDRWRERRQQQREERGLSGRIGYQLLKTGAIEESKLAEFLSKQYGVPAVDMTSLDVNQEVIKLVPRLLCEEHALIPIRRAGASLIVAFSDPSDINTMEAIRKLTGYQVELVVAGELAIQEALDRCYPPSTPPT